MSRNATIVHWSPNCNPHHCGYCKSSNGSVSNGLWAETLSAEDYQDLMDRGWRRCGYYLYKPILQTTCCPQYTIRCNALSFQISKSQKKVIKRFNKYLNDGLLAQFVQKNDDSDDFEGANDQFMGENDFKSLTSVENCLDLNEKKLLAEPADDPMDEKEILESAFNDILPSTSIKDCTFREKREKVMDVDCKGDVVNDTSSTQNTKEKDVKKGLGPDANKPKSKKAKQLRIERKMQKLNGLPKEISKKPCKNPEKNLKDLLLESENKTDNKHKLKITLVANGTDEWQRTKDLEYEIYVKYQTIVHNDKADSLSFKSFCSFLVNSPINMKLQNNKVNEEKPVFGSYHQQYWLDDKLLAVGVIDILPKCVSSVYFFYDPDYRNLILGTYGALREVDLIQKLNINLPSVKFYYMGFYIHTCQKMRYKGKMKPSFLLCPETYEWFPIEQCLPKLDCKAYARFNEDTNAKDADDSSDRDLEVLKIYSDYGLCTYRQFEYDREQFKLLAKLVGSKCIRRIIVVPIDDD